MRKYITYIVTIALMLSLVSCNDWLNISPKTEIKVSENFNNEQGYKDALTGIYLLFTKSSLYGRDLTYGMADVLGRQYTEITSSNSYYYLSHYDYTNQTSLDIIDAVWSSAYNAIANINVLISNIEKADPTIFTANNQRLIRGEAYGLRAFIHFDLLRLFGHSVITGADMTAIPYVTVYGKELTQFSTVNQVLGLVLNDLQVAEDAMKADPVYEQRTDSADDENWVRDREYKFNYYAVKLLQARVNLYKGDYQAAFDAAKTVIDQSYFTWTPSSEITTTTSDTRNRVFWQEMIFGLNIPTLRDDYTSWFTTTTGLLKSNTYWGQTFETSLSGYSADYRYEYLTYYDAATLLRYSIKLQQPESTTLLYARKLPLMRFTEAYYIAAESKLYLDGVSEALPYLNSVRTKRNIMVELSNYLTVEEVKKEILKEYMKEFVCEGQLFYYYKRTNASSIMFYTGSFSPDNYVLPLPLDELANR
jgi:hypothetical protein